MTHLSSDRISERILGEPNPEVEQHLQTCILCRDEIAAMQAGLGEFKSSVHEWAAQPTASMQITTISPRRVSWGWAAVTMSAVSLAVLPLYLNVRQAERQAENAQDSLLLNRVQAHLARPAPQPMERLMQLMSEKNGGSQ